MMTNERILQVYMLGFNDELNGRITVQSEPILIRAYNIGKADAIVSDEDESKEYEEYLAFGYLLSGERLRSERKLKEFMKTDLPKNLAEYGNFVCADSVYVKKELELFNNEL